MRTRAPAATVLALATLIAACQATPSEDGSGATSDTPAEVSPAATATMVVSLPSAGGTVPPEAGEVVEDLVAGAAADLEHQRGSGAELVAPRSMDPAELDALVSSGELRLAWPLVDLLRFHPEQAPDPDLVEALGGLTGVPLPEGEVAWVFYADVLLNWDVPAPPGYASQKRALHLAVDPEWSTLFERARGIDWREVAWVGSPPGANPALHEPEMVSAEAGGWLSDTDEVLGVVVGGEARAYPLRVMEAHGVVTDTIGGRTVVVLHDAVDGLVGAYELSGDGGRLRPAGLVLRSRELLFDPDSGVAYDPVAGVAYGGEGGTPALGPLPAATTSWGAWKEVFQETKVVSADAGIGRVYVADPRADPPRRLTYPVGTLDQRLPPREPVVTAIAEDGTAVAFPLQRSLDDLDSGRRVTMAGLVLGEWAGGLVVRAAGTGEVVPSQQASWFAWSGAHPRTVVWSG